MAKNAKIGIECCWKRNLSQQNQEIIKNFQESVFNLQNRSILSKKDWNLTLIELIDKIEKKEQEIFLKINQKRNLIIQYKIDERLYQTLKPRIKKVFPESDFNVIYSDMRGMSTWNDKSDLVIFLRDPEIDKYDNFMKSLYQSSPESEFF